MRVHILLLLICAILAVSGSPLDDKRKKTETLKENKTTKTAELGKGADTVKTSEVNNVADIQKDEATSDSLESDISLESLEAVDNRKPNAATNTQELKTKPEAESASETKLAASPNKLDAEENSAETSDVPEGRPIAHANIIIQTTSIFQAQPLVPDSVRKIGPVELGLRNVVAASAAATERYFMEMSALNAEISQLINSKSEILTSQTINNLFVPLSKVEETIKKTGDCGKAYEAPLNAIFKDIDSNLKTCSKNLTAIETQYKNENVGALTSLSFAADEMNNLPDSCDISQNFAVGTFCIVNNLAEMNDRVLADVSFIKQNTAQTEEKIVSGIAAFDVCQRKMSETVTGKLEKLLKDVTQKCIERKNRKSK